MSVSIIQNQIYLHLKKKTQGNKSYITYIYVAFFTKPLVLKVAGKVSS